MTLTIKAQSFSSLQTNCPIVHALKVRFQKDHFRFFFSNIWWTSKIAIFSPVIFRVLGTKIWFSNWSQFHLDFIRIFKNNIWIQSIKGHGQAKIIYPKYSKQWPYTVAYTIDCVRSKMLNHGLNLGLFLSLFKLIPCPIHWIVYVLAYLNFKAVLALPKTIRSAQTHKSISFIWIVWSTLYVYRWV